MIQIGRAIEGVSINGKEWLLDDNNNIMKFESQENGLIFLKENGFEVVKYSKTSNYIETLFQMWNTYLFQYILRKKWAQSLFTPFLISPITIVGILISKILPKNDSFFLNNVVVAKKIK